MKGPKILKSEVRLAHLKMNRDKAAGPNGILIEMLSDLDDFGFMEIINEIYNGGNMPNDSFL